ncbi:metallophosphoesterase [Parabacteroides sp. OttesenSCG-928-G06]|nr:metallophosphoesterase [Parabacteroides sp. OttesenSCG-928-K15]MDL2282335.1 metallophosphoesterase [Parabacteroides sp. OttesenSCG-928-G06]
MKKSLSLIIGIFLLISSTAAWSQQAAEQDTTYRFDHGPYLQTMTPQSVYVYFTTSRKGFSWVDLRPAGTVEWTRCVTIDDGLIEANNTKNAIQLKNLQPNTEYEYRLSSVPINQFRLSNNIYGDTIRTPWYTFKTNNPLATECTFITACDIHDDAERYKRMLSYIPFAKVDIAFLLGDILSHFSHVGQPYKSFIDVSVDAFAKEKPFALVRGNHDTRGQLARTYPEYIHKPGGHFYTTFQLGDTFFVLFDTGEDKDDSHFDYSGITAFEAYRTEQLEWFKEVMQTDAYKKAKHRIILGHIPPMPRGESTRASVHAGDVLYRTYLPVLNEANVDLMICGHTHRHTVHEPTANSAHNFPILINGSNCISLVTVNAEGIHVKTTNDSGEVTLDKIWQ